MVDHSLLRVHARRMSGWNGWRIGLLALLLVAACDDDASSALPTTAAAAITNSSSVAGSQEQRDIAAWADHFNDQTISYVIDLQCFCSAAGEWAVVESYGTLLEAEYLGHDLPSPDSEVPSMLLSEAVRWVSHANGPVVIRELTATSIAISVDVDVDAIDDEFSFAVHDIYILVPLPTTELIDLRSGSIYGFAAGDRVRPVDLLALLTPVLGDPTRDTGWYLTPGDVGEPDCLGGMRQRVIRWGNLGFAFWNGNDLWSWTIGDPTASTYGDRREPAPIPMTPAISATSTEGLHVGSSVADLVAVFGPDIRFEDHAEAVSPDSATLAVVYNVDVQRLIAFSLSDGVVTGIGSTRLFC